MSEREPHAADWSVKEQIIEDAELTIQFEVLPNGERVMRLFGDCLAFGNREINFDANGHDVGAGTFTGGECKPTWPMEIGDE